MADQDFISALARAREFHARGAFGDAEKAYAQLAEQHPNNVELLHLRGVLAFQTFRLADALPLLQRTAAAVPSSYKYRLNYALALSEDGQLEMALNEMEAAHGLRPDSPDILTNLGILHRSLGHLEEAHTFLEKAAQLGRSNPDCQSNYLYGLVFDLTDDAAVAAPHFAWGQRAVAAVSPQPLRPRSWLPDRRLKVGFVSSNFHEHSVAFFLEPLLESFDRQSFELFAYASVRRADAHTEKFRSIFAQWRSIIGVADAGVASQIADDEIDILVDLNGHTAGNRQMVFAQRPAPIQVAYLGYPHHSGMPTIDYRISDDWADPAGSEFPGDVIWRLPRCAWCFREEQPIERFAAAHEPSRPLTFGSFNHVGKLSPHIVKLWAKVLRAVPDSRLLIKARSLTDPLASYNLRERFLWEKIDLSRVILKSWTATRRENLEAYRYVDIALDTFPYHGTTTTCEALWMGVPVITLKGTRHSSRVGVSLLQACGIPEYIAADDTQFVELARGLAAEPARLATLHRELRGRMLASPLMDKAGTARAFEAALREMWRSQCRRAASSF